MFYSNLLKGVAIVAMAVVLTSCGGVKTQEVILKDCVKIAKQRVELKITEEIDVDSGQKEAYLDANLKVEALKDINWGWGKRVKMLLLDKDGVELIYLVSDDEPEKKGAKKMVAFGQTLGTSDKNKKELEDIVSNTKSVAFELEGIE